jgi:putative phosphoribosyl transferase
VARALKAPLDLLMVRKIGVPSQPELAAAAIVDGAQHDVVYNDSVMRMAGLRPADLAATIQRELAEIARRRSAYATGRGPIAIADRSVIIVDDGIATGTTVMAAIKALKRRGPREIVVATPVAPADTVATLKDAVGRVYCLAQPAPFIAIGLYYLDFHPLSDAEVVEGLAQSPAEPEAAAPVSGPGKGSRH